MLKRALWGSCYSRLNSHATEVYKALVLKRVLRVQPNSFPRYYHISLCYFSAVNSIVSLLRFRGPMPVSKISSSLSDQDLEEASEAGGIVELLKTRNDLILVTIKKNIHVAILKEMLGSRESNASVAFLVASVAAVTHLPRPFSQNGAALPTVELLYHLAQEEGFGNTFDSPDAICRTASRLTNLLKRDRCGTLHLAIGSESPRVTNPSNTAAPPSFPQLGAQGLSMSSSLLLAALKKDVPESIYISLSTWLARCVRYWRFLPLDEILTKLEALQAHEPPLIDVRKFGSDPGNVFIRILCRHEEKYYVESEKQKGVFRTQEKLYSLGHKVETLLRNFVSEGPQNYATMLKGISMQKFDTLLPLKLKEELLSCFYSTDEQEKKVEVLILFFDRHRHIYDVQLSSGVIRLWNVLPQEEQPSTLTWETTPLPLVLRNIRLQVSHAPQSLGDLYKNLPKELQWQLCELYAKGITDDENAPKESRINREEAAIREFLSQHSMFLFVAQDDQVYTPELLVSQKSKKLANLSDREKALAFYNILPDSGAVDLWNFLASGKAKQLPFSARCINETFLSRYPLYFRLYSPFACNRTVVGKVGCVPPPCDYLNPSFESLEDIIKFMALHAIGGVTQSSVTNNLSKGGRAYIKRVGQLTDIAEQLPMWFSVRRDKFNSGASLITYLASVNEEVNEKRSSLKLKMNDHRLDTQEPKDEWNDDWNETDEDTVHR